MEVALLNSKQFVITTTPLWEYQLSTSGKLWDINGHWGIFFVDTRFSMTIDRALVIWYGSIDDDYLTITYYNSR